MRAATYLCFAILAVLANSGCAPGGPKAQLTVRVTDDEGKPVAGATIAVLGSFRESEGKTDLEGRFTATLRNAWSAVDIVIRKRGYYSINRHIFEFSGGDVDGRWQPWNPELSFLLARRRSPVVLQHKYVEGEKIPMRDRPVGYDLIVGDWVAPVGRGLVNDFIFLAQTAATNDNSTSNRLILSFTNPSDGLIRTNIHWRNDYDLRLPPMAPEAGYSNKWELHLMESKDPQSHTVHAQANWSEDDNYYFRVRTKTDSAGGILSAIYGKIYEGIQYHPRSAHPNAAVSFEYYLNPDGTRNLESKGERPDDDEGP
jgi:hypothetical protein